MAAAYDTYDYPSYWENREYEHASETLILKCFLAKIPQIKTLLDLGAGFGRLTPVYIFRAKKTILSDPSAKLLKIARKKYQGKSVRFIQSSLENLPQRVRGKSIDLILLVRVLHHIQEPEKAIIIINKLLKKNGYLILEFANKSHFKALVHEIFKGNLTFPLDIFPKDLSKKKRKKKKTLPFVNYHPDAIIEMLESNGFEILEKRSASNVRSVLLKRLLPLEFLLTLERKLQKPFGTINFGPSIFILAKKKE